MHASNPETIYSAGSGDWTQARLITVSGSARTVPMSHIDKLQQKTIGSHLQKLSQKDELCVFRFWPTVYMCNVFTSRLSCYKPPRSIFRVGLILSDVDLMLCRLHIRQSAPSETWYLLLATFPSLKLWLSVQWCVKVVAIICLSDCTSLCGCCRAGEMEALTYVVWRILLVSTTLWNVILLAARHSHEMRL